jgi:HPt (histidine-containing phosphotransfer) domain-containing protein
MREVEEKLERLRERYREKFERELESLAAQLREAARAGYGRPQLEALQALAHRLMGTSGSYGLETSSAALARMEERLERLLATSEADVGAAWPEIESELAAARAGLGR